MHDQFPFPASNFRVLLVIWFGFFDSGKSIVSGVNFGKITAKATAETVIFRDFVTIAADCEGQKLKMITPDDVLCYRL